ncbi:protein of unknown function [Desulfovibrio sp. 86]|nr:protein of unknown function [Desulfovibrio sp. 86]
MEKRIVRRLLLKKETGKKESEL